MIDPPDHTSFEPTLVAFGLAMTRTSSFVVASPFLGRGTAPNAVKVGLCVALAMFWLPMYAERIATNPTTPMYLFMVLSEFTIGISVGFLVSLILLPAKIAGTYLGQELGFNLGQVADPTSGSPNNEAGLLFDALGLVTFWISDIHHVALRIIGASYAEVDGLHLVTNIAPTIGKLVGDSHELGILIVGPVASILFMTIVYLMLLMRAWPHVTLFSYGMGARLLLGLGAFFAFMPLIIANLELVLLNLAGTVSDLFAACIG